MLGYPVTDQHIPPIPGCRIVISRGRCYLNTNIPRLKSGGQSNLMPASKEEFKVILDGLDARLAQAGLRVHVGSLPIVRLDLFANAVLPRPLHDYKVMFDTLNVPRRISVRYPNSYYFSNASRVDIIYGKDAQIKEIADTAVLLPGNVVRMETRYKNAKVVHALGIRTADDLLEQYERVQNAFIAHMDNVLSIGRGLPSAIDLDDLDQLLNSRSLVEKALYAKAVLAKFGTLDNLRITLRQTGKTRNQINRAIKTVKDGLRQPLKTEKVNVSDLKKELFEGLVKGLKGEGM